MSDIKDKVLKILAGNRMCYIATTGNNFVDNAMVAYYAEGFELFFGSFSDTLKCKNIHNNPYIAVCIDNLQIHGKAEMIEHNCKDYDNVVKKYLNKFPQYKFYFELENNELYRIKPLVIWLYDSSKGTMHRDMIVIDNDYYNRLKPYEAPYEFRKRN